MLHSRVAIVPTRFIVSISHLIVVILCLMGTSGNVLSGLALTYTDTEFTSAKDSLVTALIVTLICIGIDFFGLFSGVSLKVNAMHAFQVISHFVALVLTTVFLLDNWAAGTMWYIFGFFVAPISACEAILIMLSLFAGKKKY